MDRPHTSRQAGFALVDVTVAIMVLAAGILGLSATMNAVVRNMRASDSATRMAALAQAEMERLFAGGYERLLGGQRDQGSYRVTWDVRGTQPKEVRLIVRHMLGTVEKADTVVTLIRKP